MALNLYSEDQYEKIFSFIDSGEITHQSFPYYDIFMADLDKMGIDVNNALEAHKYSVGDNIGNIYYFWLRNFKNRKLYYGTDADRYYFESRFEKGIIKEIMFYHFGDRLVEIFHRYRFSKLDQFKNKKASLIKELELSFDKISHYPDVSFGEKGIIRSKYVFKVEENNIAEKMFLQGSFTGTIEIRQFMNPDIVKNKIYGYA